MMVSIVCVFLVSGWYLSYGRAGNCSKTLRHITAAVTARSASARMQRKLANRIRVLPADAEPPWLRAMTFHLSQARSAENSPIFTYRMAKYKA